jgi:phage baseplate assembly protein W
MSISSDAKFREFLGQGIAFPLHVRQQGGLALAKGAQDIEQAIHIILGTIPGERMMRPEFGSRIHELVFAPDNASTRRLAAYFIEEALTRWEPRITVNDVIASSDPDHPGLLLIEIQYMVKDTYDERSIIYPFYLQGEE